MNLVIVESPAKAKTIEKYLGKDFKVMASYGHVRDLPSKNGSVDPDDDFAMIWDTDSRSKKRLKEIADAAKEADKLILATDPDREGEAISWHVLEVLNKRRILKDKPVQRVVFNAITKSAVTNAMSNPRELDMELVEAYLARRALDYLVGFTLSPVLWRKLPGSRSAGRVQSVALRLICDRENEIEAFEPREYWTVDATVDVDKASLDTKLVRLDGKKLKKFSLENEADGKAAAEKVKAADLSVSSIEAKPLKRNPPPPFTTSTLQQEASRKLGFGASRTMQVAQKLYEGINIGGETVGLITYMRTDGVQMAPEAISGARFKIAETYGDKYCPEKPRYYATKAKNTQEAHEAIRPTSFGRDPDKLKLSGDERKLYDLIWKRAIASQMATAQLERTTIELDAKDGSVGLRATGTVVRFDGFLSVYNEGKDDKAEEAEKLLPAVAEGASGKARDVKPEQHFTQPPPRFTEASLVKRMEELGIGRPSTYASTLKVLQDRSYVRLDQKRFIPEDKGRLVTAFLEKFFERYVEYDFTADLEERLDKVSAGDLGWKELLSDFWTRFAAHVESISDLRVSEVLDALNEALGPMIFPDNEETGVSGRKCPSCDDGQLSLKIGKYGAFVGCSNYPECKYTRPFGQAGDQPAAVNDDEPLGQDPETGLDVFLKSGRFGPYVQLGTEDKPKRTGLPKGWEPADIDLEKALKLLSLPRDIGAHPEDGEMIRANLGRYGPYVQHNKTYANIKDPNELWEIGLNRAVTLIAEKEASRGKRGGTAKALKELGAHPESGKPVNVMDGRYGPYVKYEKINATLPKDMKPEEVTMEKALELIEAKAQKGGKKKRTTRKKKSA